jgi:hypothetical protein
MRKKGYARTGCQASPVAAVACGALLVVTKDTTEVPFTVRIPSDQIASAGESSGGELNIAGSCQFLIYLNL